MKRELGCKECRHSLGYHVAYPPGFPSQPKATDDNLLCVWCERAEGADGWCRRDGVPRSERVNTEADNETKENAA